MSDAENTTKIEQEKIKKELIECHRKKSSTLLARIDVERQIEEYQAKFNVPKPLVIKWLNLKVQKSLFMRKQTQSDMSAESINSSIITESDNGTPKLSKKLSSQSIEELLVSLSTIFCVLNPTYFRSEKS